MSANIDQAMLEADRAAQEEFEARQAQVEKFDKATAKRANAAIETAAELAERRRKAALEAAEEQAGVDTTQFAWEAAARAKAGEPPYIPNSSGLTEGPDGVGPQTGEAPGVNGQTRLSNFGQVAGQPRAALHATTAGRSLATELQGTDSTQPLRPQASGEPRAVAARVNTPSKASGDAAI